MARRTGAPQFRGVESFAKEVLCRHVCSAHISPQSTLSICELWSGSGEEIGKLIRSLHVFSSSSLSIEYTAIDTSLFALSRAKKALMMRDHPFSSTHWIVADPSTCLVRSGVSSRSKHPDKILNLEENVDSCRSEEEVVNDDGERIEQDRETSRTGEDGLWVWNEGIVDEQGNDLSGRAVHARFDVVLALRGTGSTFSSQQGIECLVENLNCLLRPGGYFFGIAVDFSSVWFQYQHAISKQPSVESSKVFSGKLFRCVLEELESCKLEGSRIPNVSLEIVDEETKIRCYPFLFSSFMKVMHRANLRSIDIESLDEFFDSFCRLHPDLVTGYSIFSSGGKGSIHHGEMELLQLFSTFVFQREFESVSTLTDTSIDYCPINCTKS